jgi:NhaA family Na+:H+ antiporter
MSGPRRLHVPSEARPGLLLFGSAAVAVIIANSALGPQYDGLLKTPVAVGFGEAAVTLTVSSWVKNLLMAGFFFYAGLELKREILRGALSSPRRAILPLAGAIGGMALPAAIYLWVTGGGEYASGWAIPAATDIAFALGALALLGSRVPPALKAFLLAVAVVDDLGAILIIALVYTETLSMTWLAAAGACFAAMVLLNRLRLGQLWPYAGLAAPLWIALQNSGMNPTIAGVLTALAVPLTDRHGGQPLERAEHLVRPYVLYGIMPVFALSAAGVAFAQPIGEALANPVAVGIAAGLFLGKAIGITTLTLLTALVLRAQAAATPLQLLGVALLAGIGFTMSLFIGGLAFTDPALDGAVKVGVYAGSLLSACAGLLLLARTLPRAPQPALPDQARPFRTGQPVAEPVGRR